MLILITYLQWPLGDVMPYVQNNLEPLSFEIHTPNPEIDRQPKPSLRMSNICPKPRILCSIPLFLRPQRRAPHPDCALRPRSRKLNLQMYVPLPLCPDREPFRPLPILASFPSIFELPGFIVFALCWWRRRVPDFEVLDIGGFVGEGEGEGIHCVSGQGDGLGVADFVGAGVGEGEVRD